MWKQNKILFLCCRSSNKKGEESKFESSCNARREATKNGVFRSTTGPFKARIRGKSLPHRKTTATVEPRTWLERGADKDMVSEQTGKDKESVRSEKPSGVTADGARSLQPFHYSAHEGRGRTAGIAREEVLVSLWSCCWMVFISTLCIRIMSSW